MDRIMKEQYSKDMHKRGMPLHVILLTPKQVIIEFLMRWKGEKSNQNGILSHNTPFCLTPL